MIKKSLVLFSFVIITSLNFSYAQTWNQVNNDGFGNQSMEDARCMVEYKDKLYVGTATEVSGQKCGIWQYNGSTWVQVNTDGFGNESNIGILSLIVYDNFLYAGVENEVDGCEIWRTAAVGGPPFTDWQQVNSNGFGDDYNDLIGSMVVFNGHLYVGTLNEDTGCEIWRTAAAGGPPFTDWEQVNSNGFGDSNNGEAEDLILYNNKLYVGTDNRTTGCEIWRTAAAGGPPFTDWQQVNSNGFGDSNNGEAESFAIYNSYLYVGVGNHSTGCGVWRTAAAGGPPFTDWQQVNSNGFGDSNNEETYGIMIFNGHLYVGTENPMTGGEIWRTAAAGGPPFTDWEQNNDNGFGDINNNGTILGVVYNNYLYAGTSNYETGCEVWNYSDVIPDVINVPVDIKPGSCPNPLNVKSMGVFPAAIMGTENFDVTQVDPETLGLRLKGTEDPLVAPLRWAYADVGEPFLPFIGKVNCFEDCLNCSCNDDCLDLVFHFEIQEVVAALGEVNDEDCLVMEIIGNLKEDSGCTPFVGEDVIRILKKGNQ
jgi:hypothetical protein